MIHAWRAPKDEVCVSIPQDDHDAHCILRFWERYRMRVAPWFLRQLERVARQGKTEIIGETRTSGVVHRYETDRRRVHFMTDRRTGRIVTVLDEPGAIAMAVRRENARGGRGGERASHRGSMADSLEALAPRIFSGDQLDRFHRIRSGAPDRAQGDVPPAGPEVSERTTTTTDETHHEGE